MQLGNSSAQSLDAIEPKVGQKLVLTDPVEEKHTELVDSMRKQVFKKTERK